MGRSCFTLDFVIFVFCFCFFVGLSWEGSGNETRAAFLPFFLKTIEVKKKKMSVLRFKKSQWLVMFYFFPLSLYIFLLIECDCLTTCTETNVFMNYGASFKY